MNRKLFGDKISMFENIKKIDGKKRNFIKFSQKRFQKNKNGKLYLLEIPSLKKTPVFHISQKASINNIFLTYENRNIFLM